MKLSLFSDYSLRVLIYASIKNGLFQLQDVSQAYGISRNHLAQVVHRLGQLERLKINCSHKTPKDPWIGDENAVVGSAGEDRGGL